MIPAGLCGALARLAQSEAFDRRGWVVGVVENTAALDRVRALAAGAAAEFVGGPGSGPAALLNRVHERVAPEHLNELRLLAIDALCTAAVRADYLSLARNAIDDVVGNELAVQKRLNLSIQMPGDASSLLPRHADTWAGDSPFEVVLWVPLVDCFETKAMFIDQPSGRTFVNVRYGEFLLFTPTVPHGNVVNETDETRWSINCRIKSLMSRYDGKRLGEFFEPVGMKPATRIGLGYRLPEVTT